MCIIKTFNSMITVTFQNGLKQCTKHEVVLNNKYHLKIIVEFSGCEKTSTKGKCTTKNIKAQRRKN